MSVARLCVLVLGAGLALTSSASAGYFYSFTNVNDIPILGGTNTVNVFLNWDTVGTNELASPGLSGAFTGIRISQSSVGAVAVANPTMGNDIIAGAFPTNTAQEPLDFLTETGFDNLAGIIPTTGGTVTSPGGDPNRIHVGSFRLTGTAAGSVTIRAYLLNPGVGGNVATAAFADLDPFISAGSATFNVVPEPSTVALCGIGGLLFGGMALRNRLRGKQAAVPSAA